MALSKKQMDRLYEAAFNKGVERGKQMLKERFGEDAAAPSPSNQLNPKAILDMCESATAGTNWKVENVHGSSEASAYGKFDCTLILDLEKLRGDVSKYADEDFADWGYYTPNEHHRPIDRFTYMMVIITMVGKGRAGQPALSVEVVYEDARGRQVPVDPEEPVIQFSDFNTAVVQRTNDMVLDSAEDNNLGLDESGMPREIIEKYLLNAV